VEADRTMTVGQPPRRKVAQKSRRHYRLISAPGNARLSSRLPARVTFVL
jgi:hypothetical protein